MTVWRKKTFAMAAATTGFVVLVSLAALFEALAGRSGDFQGGLFGIDLYVLLSSLILPGAVIAMTFVHTHLQDRIDARKNNGRTS